MTLRIKLSIPDRFVARARYVFGFLSSVWGIRIEIISDDSERAHICYTSQTRAFRLGRPIVIPFDEDLYNEKTPCESLVTGGGRVFWRRTGTDVSGIDFIASLFRLLSLLDERQVPPDARDQFGNFVLRSWTHPRTRVADIPMADHMAGFLLDAILEMEPRFRSVLVARWPEGRSFAVCVTHDTDAVDLGAPRELLTNGIKWLLGRGKDHGSVFLKGLCRPGGCESNPLWGFDGWVAFERERGIQSTFYLSVSPQVGPRFLNDCKSTVDTAGCNPAVFQAMRGDGWEFGLHPALASRVTPGELAAEKRRLEEFLGFAVCGLRHHYLAFDSSAPEESFRDHVRAGFEHDSSVGWRETSGFRAGTSFPYRPFDGERDSPVDLIELPLTMMDNHVVQLLEKETSTAIERMVDTVRRAGGMLVLNWHTESFCNRWQYRRYRDMMDVVLDLLSQIGEAWFCTSSEVVNWWKRRETSLR